MNKLYENTCILFVLLLFILSTAFGIAGIIFPWLLIISEFIKRINLPSFLTSEKTLNWTSTGINDYFEHKVIYSLKKYEDKNYIKCLMPHGIIPFSIMSLWNNNFFNRNENTSVTAHQLYHLPFISHFMKACNSIPSLYLEMDTVLKDKKSLLVYPGGVREAFVCSEKKEILVIKKRRGIFYLALKNGVSLLPVYTFGITQLHEKSDISLKIPFLFGNNSISWYSGKYYTYFPLRKKLLTVVGIPIQVTKKEIITEEDIKNLRDKYILSVKTLFDKWKHKYDWTNKELFIE